MHLWQNIKNYKTQKNVLRFNVIVTDDFHYIGILQKTIFIISFHTLEFLKKTIVTNNLSFRKIFEKLKITDHFLYRGVPATDHF